MPTKYDDPPPRHPNSPSPLTAAQVLRYLQSPGQCPYCRSTEITDLDTQEPFPGSELRAQMRCESCGKIWNNVYTLSNIQEVPETL